MQDIRIPIPDKPQAEMILNSKVKKKIRHKIYMEHHVKWKYLPTAEATWVAKTYFKKLGISMDLLPVDPTFLCCRGRMV